MGTLPLVTQYLTHCYRVLRVVAMLFILLNLELKYTLITSSVVPVSICAHFTNLLMY